MRASGSSVCVVSKSSQSFDLDDEKDREVTGGNFREASGIDNVEAFFASDPVHKSSVSNPLNLEHIPRTLGHLERSRVPYDRCTP